MGAVMLRRLRWHLKTIPRQLWLRGCGVGAQTLHDAARLTRNRKLESGPYTITNHYWREYDKQFSGFTPTRILEIGVQRGDDFLVWQSRYPKAKLYGIDIDRNAFALGVKVFYGDQGDASFLWSVVQDIGAPLSLVVDDGSHRYGDITASFGALWPSVEPGGCYVIEDLHAMTESEHMKLIVFIRDIAPRSRRYFLANLVFVWKETD